MADHDPKAPEYLTLYSVKEIVHRHIERTLPQGDDSFKFPPGKGIEDMLDDEVNKLSNTQPLSYISNAIDVAFNIEPRSWRT